MYDVTPVIGVFGAVVIADADSTLCVIYWLTLKDMAVCIEFQLGFNVLKIFTMNGSL